MRIFKGYSLIELFITLIVVFIGLVIAIPSYKYLIDSNVEQVATDRILSAINTARLQAVLRQKTVTLCASVDGQHCKGQWQNGMLLFVDTHDSRDWQPDDIKLKVWSMLSEQVFVIWNRSTNYLQFSAHGYLKSQLGQFIFCLKRSSLASVPVIILSSTGRARVDTVNSAACNKLLA